MEITGTVQYIALEGGFYGILGDDGQKYNPTRLPEAFAHDGIKIRATLQRSSGMSLRMWGKLVDVLHIERV